MLHVSPREYPSARLSNVKLRPLADVIPAIAINEPNDEVNIMFTPPMTDAPHSVSCTARMAP